MAKKVIEQLEQGRTKKEDRYITTGSTIRDLIIGGDKNKFGYKVGNIYNIVSDASGGKCIKNAYILTENGFEYINDMLKDYDYGATEKIYTLAFKKEERVKTSHVYKEKVNHTIKIRTVHGYEIEGTEEHPIMVASKSGETLKKLKDITKEDYIIVEKGTNLYGGLKKFPKEFMDGLDKNAIRHTVPKYVNEHVAHMLGYFVADGNFTTNTLSFSNEKEWFDTQLKKDLKEFGVERNKKNGKVHSSYMHQAFFELCGRPSVFTARYKYVPKIILQSPKSVQASFLRGLIDCDGYYDNRDIEYTTASKDLANQVRMMLLNMGIVTGCRIKKGAWAKGNFYDHDYYRVTISRNYINLYSEIIGSDKYTFIKHDKRIEKSNLEQIPFLKENIFYVIDYIRKEVGWSKNGKCKLVEDFPKWKYKNMGKGYNSLNIFLNLFEDFKQYFPKEYPYEWFVSLRDNDYYYDKVSLVEHNYEETDVYDVCVPDGHLFWCNGMINHNTALAVHSIAANYYALGDKFVWRYDDAERGSTFDLYHMYGIEKPLIEDVNSISNTVEELYNNIRKFSDNLKKDQIGMYVVDSLDGLTSKATVDRGNERYSKFEKGKEFSEGTYAMEKQKFLSQEFFPDIASRIKDTNIVLIFISQVRDKINAGMFEKKQTRAGGRALQFYCHTVEWLAQVQKREMEDDATGLRSGIPILIETEKSKTPRPYRKGVIVYDFSIGVDDIASNVDYLYDLRTDKAYQLRPTKQNKLNWDDKLFQRDELCDYIYENELENELKNRVIAKWEENEAKLVNKRKPRFI